MARKKSHPLKKKLFRFFNPHGIITLVFLIVSLVATIALATNPNISLDLRNWAASKTDLPCSDVSINDCKNTPGCKLGTESKSSQVPCVENDCISGVAGCSIQNTLLQAALCSCTKEMSTAKTKADCKSSEFLGVCTWHEASYSQKCTGNKTITTTIDVCTGTRILVPSPSPSTDKTCPNADPYPPGKHGDVSWIGDKNYVCNGVNGDWIDCTNNAKLKNSPFGENFQCQNENKENRQNCTPNKCLDDNKLQTCTKTGLLPKYEITNCSETSQVCSNAECVDKVNCYGFPKCLDNPEIVSRCRIVDNQRIIIPEPCPKGQECSGKNGEAKCQATPPPPPTTYTCLKTDGQFYSQKKCDCAGVGTHPQDQNCCKPCQNIICEANKKTCSSDSVQQVCNSKGNGYTYNTCEIGCRSSDGICVETLYSGIPSHRVIGATDNCFPKEEKYNIGGSTWGCKLKTTTPPTTKIPTGQKCAGFNDDASCQSGDCRLFTNPSGWWCWDSSWNALCVPNTSTCDLKTQKTCNAEGSDYINIKLCGYGCEGNVCRISAIPTGEKCASPNDNLSCQSGDCSWSTIRWGWYCRDKSMGTECTGKETRCISSKNVLETCKDGRWQTRECDDISMICGLSRGTTYACKQCPDPVHEGVLVYCSVQQMEDSKK